MESYDAITRLTKDIDERMATDDTSVLKAREQAKQCRANLRRLTGIAILMM